MLEPLQRLARNFYGGTEEGTFLQAISRLWWYLKMGYKRYSLGFSRLFICLLFAVTLPLFPVSFFAVSFNTPTSYLPWYVATVLFSRYPCKQWTWLHFTPKFVSLATHFHTMQFQTHCSWKCIFVLNVFKFLFAFVIMHPCTHSLHKSHIFISVL